MTVKKNIETTENATIVEGIVIPTTSRIAKIKSFVTSPTFLISAPVYVVAAAALVVAARKPLEIDSEDI